TVGLGSRLMLGTDGMHSDMVRSAQQAWFTGKALEPVTVPDILKRFRNVHHYLDQAFPGMEGENNLVILDYDPPTPLDEGNFGGHFLYGMESRNVWSTIINGKLVYHEREFKDIDEKEIRARSREQATRLWKRMAATGVHR
ncbi:MAG: hypothetical protein JW874_12575, partial [Spirochaetales bacterium]|nr:hypothetical protein [Spirochaetales bacterium]